MKLRVATPLGLSCTLPPSCFTFFSLLLVSFVSRLGLVRLDSAMLGPRTVLPFSPSLFLSLSSVSLSQGPLPLQPLATITGPHSYQPLVFTSDQVGGDLNKTTSKLRYPRLPLSLPSTQTRQFDSRGGREGRRTQHEYTSAGAST